MKTKLLLFAIVTTLATSYSNAQNRTTIYANNGEISDNLDLKAVASVFGEASNLQDFERRLNDPRRQLSNLDLNYDNQVDYLRVIESVENRTHVIVIQAVLGRDLFQDVATIDVERDRYNNVSVQVVGDVFMYGSNYIYEPVYFRTPAIYASFWIGNYRPYYSRWNWNYYPTYYYAWNPFPVYRYRNNINTCINVHNSYRYVSYRNSNRAPEIYALRRHNAYEKNYPNYSFSRRNSEVVNRYELDRRNDSRNTGNDNRSANRYEPSIDRNNTETSVASSRSYTDNRSSTSSTTNNDYRENYSRVVTPVRVESTRNYSENSNSNRNSTTNSSAISNRNSDYSSDSNSREYTPQRTEQRAPQTAENRRTEYTTSNTRGETSSVNRSESRRGNRGM